MTRVYRDYLRRFFYTTTALNALDMLVFYMSEDDYKRLKISDFRRQLRYYKNVQLKQNVPL